MVVILGITERSGTNFVRDLLVRHPGLRGTDIVFEDFLVAHSGLLRRFCESVHVRWTLNPRIDEQLGGATGRLMEALGDGLASLVASTANARDGTDMRPVVTKTPSVENIRHALELFPKANFVVVVRDPAAVVDSGMKTFGWSFEKAVHLWANGAKQILEFERVNSDHGHRFRIVRYEDLAGEQMVPHLTALLEFVGADPNQYDFAGAANMPVKGSSALGAKSTDLAGWQRVEKPKDFDPLARGKKWSPLRRARLARVAREGIVAWGYAMPDSGGVSAVAAVLNPFQDIAWGFREMVRRTYRALPDSIRGRLRSG